MFTTDTKVALITEDPMVEIAVRHLLGSEHNDFVLYSVTGFQLRDRLDTAKQVDVVLVDLFATEDMSKLEDLRTHFAGIPLLAWCGPAVMTVSDEIRDYCDGVISRLLSSDEFMEALRQVSGRSRGAEPDDKCEVRIHLTYRESQLVTLLARGYKNKEIASCLGISAGTVKVYLSTLFKKTGAKDRLELSLFGMKNSLYGVAEASRRVPSGIAARRAISRPAITSMRLLRPALEGRPRPVPVSSV